MKISYRFDFEIKHGIFGFLIFLCNFISGFVGNIILSALLTLGSCLLCNMIAHYTYSGMFRYAFKYAEWYEERQVIFSMLICILSASATGNLLNSNKTGFTIFLILSNVGLYFANYYFSLAILHKNKVIRVLKIQEDIKSIQYKFNEGENVKLTLPQEEHCYLPTDMYKQLKRNNEYKIVNKNINYTTTGEKLPCYRIETKGKKYPMISEDWLEKIEEIKGEMSYD